MVEMKDMPKSTTLRVFSDFNFVAVRDLLEPSPLSRLFK